MHEAILVIYMALGGVMQPVNFPIAHMADCQTLADRRRERGTTAYCLRTSGIINCANCGAPLPPVG